MPTAHNTHVAHKECAVFSPIANKVRLADIAFIYIFLFPIYSSKTVVQMSLKTVTVE